MKVYGLVKLRSVEILYHIFASLVVGIVFSAITFAESHPTAPNKVKVGALLTLSGKFLPQAKTAGLELRQG